MCGWLQLWYIVWWSFFQEKNTNKTKLWCLLERSAMHKFSPLFRNNKEGVGQICASEQLCVRHCSWHVVMYQIHYWVKILSPSLTIYKAFQICLIRSAQSVDLSLWQWRRKGCLQRSIALNRKDVLKLSEGQVTLEARMVVIIREYCEKGRLLSVLSTNIHYFFSQRV